MQSRMIERRFAALARSLVVAGLLVLSMCYPAPQAARAQGVRCYVDAGAGGGNGGSWGGAYTDLQLALGASACTEVWVAQGTYKPTSTTDRTISFALKSGVALYGGFAGGETDFAARDPALHVTVLSGDIGTIGITADDSHHVVVGSGTDSSAVLDGFKITSGNANGWFPIYSSGGGMYNNAGSPTLANLVFAHNLGYQGGGIGNDNASAPHLTSVTFDSNGAGYYGGGGMYNDHSSPTLNNVTFTANTSGGSGGGMFNDNSNPELTLVTFLNNSTTSGGGGGIWNNDSSPTLTDVTFTGNSAPSGAGGGIANNNEFTTSNPTLTRVTFTSNSAASGGGIHNHSGSPHLTDVTFTSNSSAEGGGMDNDASSNPVLSNVTFSSNTSTDYGGGMSNFRQSSPTLDHVVFIGNTAGTGGGLYNATGSAVLTDVSFSGNAADHGGGMYNSESNPALTNVVFRANKATWFGGGLHNSGGSPALTRVTFDRNTAQYGGGMQNDSGSPILTDVTFTGNSARSSGGGLMTDIGDPTLSRVTFSGNKATNYGGAIHIDNSNPTITNATVTNNIAASGGGMYVSSTTATLRNVTFSGNKASRYGSGMYSSFGGNPKIYNSILWDGAGETYILYTTPVLTDVLIAGGCPSGATCTRIATGNPLLGALQHNGGLTQTMALGTGSPAINHGNNATCADKDQRGVARPVGAACDLGAFEYRSEALFSASPAAGAFGLVKVGGTATAKVFTVKNIGPVTLTMGTVTLAGADPDQFQLTADACSGAALAANATCTVSARFAPTSAGAKAAQIDFGDNAAGGPHSIALTGAGATQLALNGGFNTYPSATARVPTKWTAASFGAADGKDATVKKEGAASVKMAGAAGKTKSLTQSRSVSGAAGSSFVLSVWAKGQAIPPSGGVVQAKLLLYKGSTLVKSGVVSLAGGTYGFKQKTLGLTAPGAYDRVVIKLIYSRASGTAWFDGLSLLVSP